MPPKAKCLIWDHFHKIDTDTATCNYCKSAIVCKQGNTSSIRRHLKTHPSELDKLLKAEAERLAVSATVNKRPRLEDQPTLEQHAEMFSKFGQNSSQQLQFNTEVVDMLCTSGTAFNWVEVNN